MASQSHRGVCRCKNENVVNFISQRTLLLAPDRFNLRYGPYRREQALDVLREAVDHARRPAIGANARNSLGLKEIGRVIEHRRNLCVCTGI
jgi:hypothetical protein